MERIAKQTKAQSNVLKKASINETDVLIIWDALAGYIRQEMSRKRGIVMPGFGTFTFVEIRIDIGNNKEIVKIKPFFLLSDKFAQKHSLEFGKDHINTSIPVHRLNYVSISEATKFKYSREIVEAVLSEAFTAIDHFLRVEGVITLPFKGLGILRIQDVNPKPKKQVKFDFSSAMSNHLPIY